MSEWAARSNYFHVKDLEAFRAEFAKYDVIIVAGRNSMGEDSTGKVALGAGDHEEGTWPRALYDEATGEDIDIDIPDLVAPHLADGEVAVFMECGHDKLAYLQGWSRAINNKGEDVTIHLSDIYNQAKHLGTSITDATY